MSTREAGASALHHLALGAVDVEGVAAFYREVFGLPERQRHHTEGGALRSVWLELGDALLMVERSEGAPRRVDGVGSGPFLIAFRVTAAARSQMEARLASAGSSIENRSEWTSYARDPEGNRIAISAY